jgi:uncharacterized protein YxeA
MKKILFMFLCLSFLDPLFAQSSYSSANQDTETNTEYVKENDPNDISRDISSETDQESDKNELDEIERKTEQDNYEPENIPEEEENL